ncbi:hypothetical protein TRFO_39715 [Tritrichomonas foetus]|uniref:Uncharacterized protein n=1 Tax=Tritrichomonas foetus TaxID=1144522 RepID=A0A1J4J7B4_9EUKA|nr:hypothetical protein TRFO_39715 [Tritrichomonas foetus]|eukprot:OHS94079.1 hypothetical protein TRFO_39715 [Tritrichomonas foetus]
MKSAREAAASASNDLIQEEGETDNDTNFMTPEGFASNDCQCYPCKLNIPDEQKQNLQDISAKITAEQQKLAKLATITSQTAKELEKKKENKSKKLFKKSISASPVGTEGDDDDDEGGEDEGDEEEGEEEEEQNSLPKFSLYKSKRHNSKKSGNQYY